MRRGFETHPSSATRPAGTLACNRSARAGFAAARGGGGASPVPPQSPLPHDFPEDVVCEKGHGTCHANRHGIVARCEPYAPPNTGSCTSAQNRRDRSKASRLLVVGLLFHAVNSLDLWTRRSYAQRQKCGEETAVGGRAEWWKSHCAENDGESQAFLWTSRRGTPQAPPY